MSLALETLLPHRSPMLWIDELLTCTETTASATVCFGAEHGAVADGVVLETALVECMAQTIAAAVGQRSQAQGGAESVRNEGMLVAVARFQIVTRPECGQPLLIEVRELKRFGSLLLIAGKVSSGGQVIATGELTLYA